MLLMVQRLWVFLPAFDKGYSVSKNTNDVWPSFSEEEGEAVKRVLLSNRVNYQTERKGEGRKFEGEFAAFAGTTHAIAVANGTVALDLALYGFGIGTGDEVIVTPRSFIASASCVVNAGAVPVFADVDRDSQNITPETVAPLITDKTRAIILVHLAGWPCDMDGFKALVAGKNIKLIEDCAQAHGAQYKGRPVGGLGDVAAWSFCTDKIMTTGGEGGMVTCNDEALWKRMWAFMNHGKSWDLVNDANPKPGFRWLHESIGTNWRLTEMQSAIGRIQLRRMPQWHDDRTINARLIMEKLKQSNRFRVPEIPDHIEHGFYKLHAFVNGSEEDRDALLAKFNKLGIPGLSGSCSEIYREKAFGGGNHEVLPVAKELGETSVMFLVHPGYDAQRIVDLLDHIEMDE